MFLLLSFNRANIPEAKYKAISGTAKNAIVKGSAVGVNAAVKSTIEKTHISKGLKIVCPRRNQIRFKLIKKTGNSKANPKSKIIRSTKSK